MEIVACGLSRGQLLGLLCATANYAVVREQFAQHRRIDHAGGAEQKASRILAGATPPNARFRWQTSLLPMRPPQVQRRAQQ